MCVCMGGFLLHRTWGFGRGRSNEKQPPSILFFFSPSSPFWKTQGVARIVPNEYKSSFPFFHLSLTEKKKKRKKAPLTVSSIGLLGEGGECFRWEAVSTLKKPRFKRFEQKTPHRGEKEKILINPISIIFSIFSMTLVHQPSKIPIKNR